MSELAARNGWTRVTFGEMAENVAERVEPTPDDGESYVGLEHLDSGSLTVRRWGADVALIGTKLRMLRGDILFAKRNAYLRRVAIAPHDGLFSAHGMVLRARPDVVFPQFLPFFMQSDLFMERAKEISVGSLSPTINWKTLAKEEFVLPPLEEQRLAASVLRASVAQQDALHNAFERVRRVLAAELVARLDHGSDPLNLNPQLPPGWLYVPLGELISIRHGFAFDGEHFTGEQTSDPILLTPGNFSQRGELLFPPTKTTRFQGEPPEGYWLDSGDLVVLMTDLTPAATLLGAPGIVDSAIGPVLQNQRIGLVKNLAPSRVRDSFLFYSFRGGQLRRVIRALSAGSTVSHTSPAQICSLRIPLPPIEIQDELIARWMLMTATATRIELRLNEAKNLSAMLRDRALGDH